MLYELGHEAQTNEVVKPLPFKSFSDIGLLEKDLENFFMNNFMEMFEESPLFPFFQERQYQKEPDIATLNAQGDLVLFELKRDTAKKGALHQLLKYVEKTGDWSYQKLNEKFKDFSSGDSSTELFVEHSLAFGLEEPLDPAEFNKNQFLKVVGHAGDKELFNSTKYWKRQGLNIDFLPYRLYEIGDKYYFEFFSPPHDHHTNPADLKGVIFDTNPKRREGAEWEMFENDRVIATHGSKEEVTCFNYKDFVFFYYPEKGIIGAGRITSSEKKIQEKNVWYHDVEFLTPKPNKEEGIKVSLSPERIRNLTGKNDFWWARTAKRPYLTVEESERIINELRMEF